MTLWVVSGVVNLKSYNRIEKDLYVIAEVGQAHDGSLGFAHSFVDIAAKRGADAVKFQMHIASAESSAFESWRVKFSQQDDDRYSYWKRMEFTADQWSGLKSHCDEVGVDFLCSPFSIEAVNVLQQMGVKDFKIASGETTNFLMLDLINSIAERIYLSSGMSDVDETSQALTRFDDSEKRVAVLQCQSRYPVPLACMSLDAQNATFYLSSSCRAFLTICQTGSYFLLLQFLTDLLLFHLQSFAFLAEILQAIQIRPELKSLKYLDQTALCVNKYGPQILEPLG